MGISNNYHLDTDFCQDCLKLRAICEDHNVCWACHTEEQKKEIHELFYMEHASIEDNGEKNKPGNS